MLTVLGGFAEFERELIRLLLRKKSMLGLTRSF
jgi:hypothetical protein